MGVVDLDPIVRQWVTQYYDDVEDSNIEIDWHRVKEKTVASSFPQDQPDGRHWQTRNAAPEFNSDSQRSQIVFTSNYDNKTPEVQRHTFIIERTTEATVKTKVTKGFSKSGSVGIKIDVPENIRNVTGSFGSDISIDSQDDNMVKHSVTWSLNSEVNAQPKSRTTAHLRITEDEHVCNFNASVVQRGTVIARITDGSDRVFQASIATIVEDMGVNGVKIKDNKATWELKGSLHFKFGISQDTTVTSQRI